jgi:uncharacterized protein YoxC
MEGLLLVIAFLLGAILVVLCVIFVIMLKAAKDALKAANEIITALQSLHDDDRKRRSS